MRHLISILLQNEAGALARVAGLFAARGYNIESLTVAATHDSGASRLSLVIFGDDAVVEQIIKQSRKLIDVLEIVELTRRNHVERELLVARVETGCETSLAAHLETYGARLLDRSDDSFVVEFTGRAEEVDRFVLALGATAEICDYARSGIAAIEQRIAAGVPGGSALIGAGW
jgi:acetolactate synthase-1/3 small subunit